VRASGTRTLLEKDATVKKLSIVVALTACATPTIAGSWVTTSNCQYSPYYGSSSCQRITTYVSNPARDIEQQQRDAIDRQNEAVKWEQFCQPTFRTDAYRRASYAKSGCEFGRSE
jgi:hypothetical protein